MYHTMTTCTHSIYIASFAGVGLQLPRYILSSSVRSCQAGSLLASIPAPLLKVFLLESGNWRRKERKKEATKAVWTVFFVPPILTVFYLIELCEERAGGCQG